MKSSTEQGLETTKKIMEEVIPLFSAGGDFNQMKIQIHPIIANSMYNRDKELLQKERFRTIYHLSRVFSDDEMDNVIKSLGFNVTI